MKIPPPTIAYSFQPASLTTRLVVSWFAAVTHVVGSSSSHTLIVRDLLPTVGAVHVNETVPFFPATNGFPALSGFPFASVKRTSAIVWFVSLPETTIERSTFRLVAFAFPFAFVKFKL